MQGDSNRDVHFVAALGTCPLCILQKATSPWVPRVTLPSERGVWVVGNLGQVFLVVVPSASVVPPDAQPSNCLCRLLPMVGVRGAFWPVEGSYRFLCPHP